MMGEYLYCILTRNDKKVVSFQCPSCGGWADIDDDQFNARVSIDHGPECKFHETIDVNVIGRKVSALERQKLMRND